MCLRSILGRPILIAKCLIIPCCGQNIIFYKDKMNALGQYYISFYGNFSILMNVLNLLIIFYLLLIIYYVLDKVL